MSKASIGVVKHLPIPAKAVAPVADFSAAGVAVRDIVWKRMQIDAEIAQHGGQRIGKSAAPVPVPQTGPQPFPTGDREAVPFVVSPTGETTRLAPETRDPSLLPDGMTGDLELLERMGVSPMLAQSLVDEANGGPPVLPTAGFTVAETHPTIIADADAVMRGTTLEEIVAENGATDTAPLLDLLAPPPTFEQH